MLQIAFLVFQLLIVIYLAYTCLAFIIGAPFVATKTSAALTMIRLAGIKRGSKVYDLGSGDGKLLLLAKNAGAISVGFEINPILVFYANVRGARTQWKNFWHADIHDADILFIYLLPTHMDRLEKKIKKECKKGTTIVSNSFIFPGWDILKEDRDNHIYVFNV